MEGDYNLNNFEFESIDAAYTPILKAVLKGEKVSPRGEETRELSPVMISITNPRKRVISNKTRKLNYAYMIANTLWIMQGRNDVDSIVAYNHNLAQYSDNGEVFNGAYGQRIFRYDGLFDVIDSTYTDDDGNTHPDFDLQHIVMNQFENVFNKLKEDADSRQAVISIFNPVQDETQTKDKPCTCMLQFLIRNGKLNLITTMRSNDAYLGMPYDLYTFTMLQEIMADKLGIDVGTYTHVANSLHIYKKDIEAVKAIIADKSDSVYKDFEPLDARLGTALDSEMANVYNVEATTRNLSKIVTLDKIESMLYAIKNEYWRSVAAVIALYNMRRAGVSVDDLMIVHNYISNEFADLIGVEPVA
jgi:thymidylate synthase